MAVLRNFAAIKSISRKIIEWILILLGVVLGVLFFNRKLLGWLPILGNLEYSITVYRFKHNENALKIAFVINMVMYCV